MNKKTIFVFVFFSLISLLLIPSVVAVKTFHVQETDLVTISPEALDPDHDEVTYTFFPPFDENGQWQTGLEDAGEYRLRILASDGKNQTAQEIILIVDNKNQLPYLKEKKITVKELQQVDLRKFVADPDQDVLEFDFTPPFDKLGLWVPQYEDNGIVVAKFTVRDGEFTIPMRLEIEVIDIDRAPELHLPEKVEVYEGGNLNLNLDVIDPDGDKVELSLSGLPEGATFDSKNKTIRWSPGFDYIKRRGGFISNVLNALRLEQRLLRDKKEHLEVKACSNDLCSRASLTVVVYNSNQPPILKMPPSLTVTETEVLQLEPAASDPDGDIIRYYFTEPVHRRKGHWETAYEDAGEYTVYVTATDGTPPKTSPITIRVLQKNRQPALSVARDEFFLKEGEEFALPVQGLDPDNDSLSLKVENLPPGALFKNNTFTWTPAYTFSTSKEESSLLSEISFLAGKSDNQREHWVSFVASDKEFDVNHPVKLIVQNVNQKPELRDFTPATEIALGKPFVFAVDVFDVDGDNLTYTWNFEPGRDVVADSSKVERTFVNPGEKKVSVVVSDGLSEVRQDWVVYVPEPPKVAPVVIPEAPVALEEPKFRVYVIEH